MRFLIQIPPSPTRRSILFLIFPLFVFLVLVPSAEAQLAFGLGGTMDDSGRAIALDAEGNMYLTGYFNGTVDFDPSPDFTFEMTAVDAQEAAFIASYDSDGNLRYARSFKGEGNGIAVDADGNVFVTGEIGSGGVDVDPGPDEVILDWVEGRVFVVSYDPGGNFRFGFNVGGGTTNLIEKGNAIGVDDTGNIYLTGIINDETDFDPSDGGELLIPVEGNTDAFLASYTNLGGLRYAFAIGSSGTEIGLDIAVDPAGNSFISGTFWNTVDFDPGPEVEARVSNGNRDLFLASYTANGGFRFALSAGAGSVDLGNSVAFDPAGNSFLTGAFRGQVDFDPGPSEYLLTSEGNEDFFLASYTDLGDFRFAFSLGNTNPIQGLSIAIDDLGHAYVTGEFTNSVDFDPGPGDHTIHGGTPDAFVASYTNAGAYRYSYSFPNIGIQESESGQGIAVDSLHRPHVTGSFNGTNDFDPGPGVISWTANGSKDIFLARNAQVLSAVESAGMDVVRGTAISGFPNPTSGHMRFNLAVPESGNVSVVVYDLAGRLVKRLHDGFLPAGARRTLMFDGENLPSGHYFVRVNDHRGSQVQRLVIVR